MPAKRLVVCCDGTWNTPDQRAGGVPVPTNVKKFHACLADTGEDGMPQLRHYHPGVGTGPDLLDRLAGGLTGTGISMSVKSGYKWLLDHYEAGDEIWLVGFSRGAYTARSLGGLLAACLLPRVPPAPREGESWTAREERVWTMVEEAWTIYRRRPNDDSTKRDRGDYQEERYLWRARHDCDPDLSIRFVGVWDTVGALGIPKNMALFNAIDDFDNWLHDNRFHDVTLSKRVESARHAVAIDEKRATFAPTLWEGVAPERDVKQVWFAGVHADVGGGYRECGLSDIALRWMIDEARALGAGFRPEMLAQIQPDPRGVLHDSWRGVFALDASQPRAMPWLGPETESVHPSVIERMRCPPLSEPDYRPSRRLAPGESLPGHVRVFARDAWTWTGLHVRAGERYELTADGQWVDGGRRSGPEGDTRGHLLADAVGALRRRSLRRVPDAPWSCLAGAVANQRNPGVDAAEAPMQTFAIGARHELLVQADGYLHAFANDARLDLDDNHGSVRLFVRRLA